jgi:uncharacterized protein YndB with AHSA1/START domain
MTDIKVRKDQGARTFDMSIDIAATPDAVWSALTEARELTRWFPLEARVTPGEGGSMFWGWGGGWAGESAIAGWEPNRRLKLIETRQGFDADGKPLTDPGDNRELAVEVTLESRAGKTRVRLVHSGFGVGANWDDELDGVSAGWQFELRTLRHYLERHRGRNRIHAWARASSDLTAAEVWARLLESRAFELPRPLPSEGRPYTVRFGTHHLSGTTLMTIPDEDFAGTAGEVHDGLFRIGTFRAAGRTGVMVWLSSYDEEDAPKVKAFERDAQSFLDRTFAASSVGQP